MIKRIRIIGQFNYVREQAYWLSTLARPYFRVRYRRRPHEPKR